MERTKRQKLVESLYSTEALMDFMCRDFYQELLAITPKTLYVSSKNISNKVRKINLQKVKEKIVKFILTNENYKQELFKHYKHKMLSPILYDTIVGLTFYIAMTSDKYQDIDIFQDKRSICYHTQTILDFI